MRKRRNRRRRKRAGKRLRLAAIVFTIMALGGAACILLRAEKEASFSALSKIQAAPPRAIMVKTIAASRKRFPARFLLRLFLRFLM